MTDKPLSRSTSIAYTERLFTPWWWYPAAVGVAALLGGEFATAFSGVWPWIVAALIVLISLLVPWRLSSGRVTVTDGEIQAGDRRLPLTQVDRVIGLSPDDLRRLVGRHGDPSSFSFIRSWVGPGVQLVVNPAYLNDLGYPTPYWVLSSRHPERLLAVLRASSAPTS